MKLLNKKVLLLGATGGIGSFIARDLITEGAKLIICGRSAKKLAALRQEIDCNSHAVLASYDVDFLKDNAHQELKNIALSHPDIDVVIHALGINSFENFRRATDSQIKSMFSVNVFSFMQVARILTPNLLQRPEAALVVIGSTFGSIGYPGFSGYCASKFALRGYVESLRRELSHSDLEVLYIAPRATDTELNDDSIVALNKTMGNSVDSPAYVAQQIIKAIHKNQLNSFLGWPEKLFVRINALSTHLVDRAIYKKIPLIKQFLL